jgi:hypothetical protein
MLTVAHRLEIADLYGRYSHAFDDGHGDEVARLFTADGTFAREGAEPVVGQANLAAMANAAAGRGMRHMVSNIVIEPAPDGASGRAYALVLVVGSVELRLATFGRYDDEFVRTPAGWRFRARRFTPFVTKELAGAVVAATVQ